VPDPVPRWLAANEAGASSAARCPLKRRAHLTDRRHGAWQEYARRLDALLEDAGPAAELTEAEAEAINTRYLALSDALRAAQECPF
jgi:hypothetical protein